MLAKNNHDFSFSTTIYYPDTALLGFSYCAHNEHEKIFL